MPIRINKTSPKLNRVVISSSDMRKELDRAISVEANKANKGNKEEITHIIEQVASMSFIILHTANTLSSSTNEKPQTRFLIYPI